MSTEEVTEEDGEGEGEGEREGRRVGERCRGKEGQMRERVRWTEDKSTCGSSPDGEELPVDP